MMQRFNHFIHRTCRLARMLSKDANKNENAHLLKTPVREEASSIHPGLEEGVRGTPRQVRPAPAGADPTMRSEWKQTLDTAKLRERELDRELSRDRVRAEHAREWQRNRVHTVPVLPLAALATRMQEGHEDTSSTIDAYKRYTPRTPHTSLSDGGGDRADGASPFLLRDLSQVVHVQTLAHTHKHIFTRTRARTHTQAVTYLIYTYSCTYSYTYTLTKQTRTGCVCIHSNEYTSLCT